MRFSATEIARVVGGDLVSGTTADADVAGVAIDSRSVSGGELFVPIVAERDGHEFIAVAVANGAVAYLTSNGRVPADGADGAAVAAVAIAVDDTGRALLELGTAARSRLSAEVGDRVIGITGSVGKTTVKDLTAAALAPRYTVQSSPRSFNNELGVPLTLANSPDDVDAVV
ncbi:MAG: UDP-N-acetylmuramoyl-tripeptide--D-alanyl-D-alanine ligase, partial [Acidimicrobiaceae bacterium]